MLVAALAKLTPKIYSISQLPFSTLVIHSNKSLISFPNAVKEITLNCYIMCIYYKGREGLTYNAQEHVIPAGLGGRLKLPKGFVSDEFNNHISKLEQQFIRESVISFPRQFEGPGKRGRKGDKHAVKSKVLLYVREGDVGFSLGYMQRGQSREIPSILLNLNNGNSKFSMPTGDEETAQDALKHFVDRLQVAEKFRIKQVSDERLPLGIILIGVEDAIEENFDCFVFRNEDTKAEINAQTLKGLAPHLSVNVEKGVNEHGLGTTQQSVKLDPNVMRIYAKIAFNFLAAGLGYETALLPMFDDIRDWITGQSQLVHAWFEFNDPSPFANVSPALPEKCHTIALYQVGGQLQAHVAIYGLPVKVLLSNHFNGKIHPAGMVCDWDKQTESNVRFNL
jgi:hypothetical protein